MRSNLECIWRTGKFAMNKDIEKSLGLASNQKILGFLYVGTPCGKVKDTRDQNRRFC